MFDRCVKHGRLIILPFAVGRSVKSRSRQRGSGWSGKGVGRDIGVGARRGIGEIDATTLIPWLGLSRLNDVDHTRCSGGGASETIRDNRRRRGDPPLLRDIIVLREDQFRLCGRTEVRDLFVVEGNGADRAVLGAAVEMVTVI